MRLPNVRRLSGLPFSLLLSAAILALPACEPGPAQQPDTPVTAALGETFGLAVGQTATILPEQITLTLTKIVEDSRCPANVSCVWSGQLVVEIAVTHSGSPLGSFQLNSIDAFRNKDKPVFESYNVTLVKATPSRFYENFGKPGSAIREIDPSEYLVSFTVNQVSQSIVPADRAELGQRVKVPNGQTADFASEGLRVQFAALVEDTRCPMSPLIACYTSGKGTVQLALSKAGLNRTANLSIPGLVQDTTQQLDRPDANASVTDFAGYRIRLVSLDPFPTDPNTPKLGPEAYVATLLVTAG